jgi:hypothetical protein
MSKPVMLLTYRGRSSGRIFATPISYVLGPDAPLHHPYITAG